MFAYKILLWKSSQLRFDVATVHGKLRSHIDFAGLCVLYVLSIVYWNGLVHGLMANTAPKQVQYVARDSRGTGQHTKALHQVHIP